MEDELQYGLQAGRRGQDLDRRQRHHGIQTQAYATSVLATLRKGLTKLETAGSLVLHRLDWKDVELARASSKRCRAVELAL